MMGDEIRPGTEHRTPTVVGQFEISAGGFTICPAQFERILGHFLDFKFGISRDFDEWANWLDPKPGMSPTCSSMLAYPIRPSRKYSNLRRRSDRRPIRSKRSTGNSGLLCSQ